MDERGITKGTAIGVLVVIIVIAAGYTFLTGGGKTTELKVSNLVFCERKPRGHQRYEEQPNATYSKENFNQIWLYADVDNLETEPTDEKGVFRIWLTVKFVVEKNGSEVMRTEATGNPLRFEEEVIEKLYIERALGIRKLSRGTYTLKMIVTDEQADCTRTLTGEFTIV